MECDCKIWDGENRRRAGIGTCDSIGKEDVNGVGHDFVKWSD